MARSTNIYVIMQNASHYKAPKAMAAFTVKHECASALEFYDESHYTVLRFRDGDIGYDSVEMSRAEVFAGTGIVIPND